MGIIVGAKEQNLKTAQAFATKLFWQPECEDLYAPGHTLEFPFTPPGWLETLSPSETDTHFAWLRRTVKSWEWKNAAVYSTNFPDKFWLMRDCRGEVFWAGKDGAYAGRWLTLLTVEAGRITHQKDYIDILALYEAIGVALPLFKYDAPPAESMPEKPPVPDLPGDGEALAQKTRSTLAKFVAVDFWDDGEINANDIVHELPYAPHAMPKRYEGREYDALNEWIMKNCLRWQTYPGSVLYETDTPGVFFIESAGCGFMGWSGVKGTYQQRELSFLRIEGGYAREFHEYFNPVNKFNSINESIPTFPYLF